jgi:hypothetical protein
MIKAKEIAMAEYVPWDPACPKCGYTIVDVVHRDDLNMTLVCCAADKCGTVIAYRDDLLIEKLDEIIEVLKLIRQTPYPAPGRKPQERQAPFLST